MKKKIIECIALCLLLCISFAYKQKAQAYGTGYVVKGDTVKITDYNGTKKTKWKVANKKIAKVTKKGKYFVTVKGLKKGNTVVKAKVGKKTIKHKVVVEQPVLSESIHEMAVGDYDPLEITGTKQSCTWTSSDENIVEVSEYTGHLDAKAEGTATVTAKVGKKKFTCEVIVDNPILSSTDIKFSYIDAEPQIVTLTGTTRPVTWVSSDTNVATVENGVITPHNKGYCNIAVTVGSKNTYSVLVDVNSYAKPVTIPYGQSWVVDGNWDLKIDSVTKTAERNEFSTLRPSAVYIVKYTYKNIGYQDAEGLYWSIYGADSIVDSKGQTGYTYPVDVDLYPSNIRQGTSCTAEECFGLVNDGNFIIQISKVDNNGITRTAIMEVNV